MTIQSVEDVVGCKKCNWQGKVGECIEINGSAEPFEGEVPPADVFLCPVCKTEVAYRSYSTT